MAQSTRQRGRSVPRQSAPLRLFYIVLGLVALAGVAVLVALFSNRPPTIPASDISVSEAVRPLSAPTGMTPEGFAYKGDPNAPVKVIEYADFQCPACHDVFQLIEPTIDKLYVETGKVQLIFQDFPLSQHANAIPAAEAARSAGAQGQFWPMHDLLYSRQAEWAESSNPDAIFAAYAVELGLDQAAFAQSLASDTYVQPLQQAVATAIQNNIQATPTFVVNGQAVDATQLQAAIEAALAAGGS